MKIKKFVFFTVLLASLWGSSAFAGLRVNLLGTLDDNMNSKANSSFGFGAGGSLELKFGGVGLEVGYLYTRRNMSQQGQAYGNYGDVPILFRFYFGKLISLGLGAFYELPMDTTVNSFYGATADITLRIPFGSAVGFIVRPRYSYDLKNTGSAQMNFFSGIVGFEFGM